MTVEKNSIGNKGRYIRSFTYFVIGEQIYYGRGLLGKLARNIFSPAKRQSIAKTLFRYNPGDY